MIFHLSYFYPSGSHNYLKEGSFKEIHYVEVKSKIAILSGMINNKKF